MDGKRFDELTKGLARGGFSRRKLLKGLGGGVLGGLLGLGSRERASAFICRPGGYLCGLDAQCCSGTCDPTTHQCTCADASQSLCGDRCTDLTTVTDCGECDNACAAGQGCCGGSCTDLTTTTNCGGCGTRCEASQGCCEEVCTDLTSPANCGGCGQVCPIPAHATATCTATGCGYTCNTGYADCNGLASDGCEVNTTTDVNNCGACGHACPSGESCVSGACTCNGTSCAGCCNSGTCVALADQTLQLCGSNGQTCAPCPACQTCDTNTGSCVKAQDVMQCGKNGICCGGSCIENGVCCVSTECGPGQACGDDHHCHCTTSSCSGCCDGIHCIAPVDQTDTQCGSNGQTCAGCPTCRHCDTTNGGCVTDADATACTTGGIGGVCCSGQCVAGITCCTNADCTNTNPCFFAYCGLGNHCYGYNQPDETACTTDGQSGLCCSGQCMAGAECCTNADCPNTNPCLTAQCLSDKGVLTCEYIAVPSGTSCGAGTEVCCGETCIDQPCDEATCQFCNPLAGACYSPCTTGCCDSNGGCHTQQTDQFCGATGILCASCDTTQCETCQNNSCAGCGTGYSCVNSACCGELGSLCGPGLGPNQNETLGCCDGRTCDQDNGVCCNGVGGSCTEGSFECCLPAVCESGHGTCCFGLGIACSSSDQCCGDAVCQNGHCCHHLGGACVGFLITPSCCDSNNTCISGICECIGC